MRLHKVIFLIISLFPLIVMGQSDILSKKMKLSYVDTSLKIVLNDLTINMNVQLSYSDDVVPINKKVTFTLEGTLAEILEIVLQNTGITYQIFNNQIVLVALNARPTPQQYTVNGYVKDDMDGENLLGASIVAKNQQSGVISNAYGFYSLSLPEGDYEIIYSFLGYAPHTKKIQLSSDINHDVRLTMDTLLLNELVVEVSTMQNSINSLEMSSQRLTASEVKQMPALLGEADIVSSLLLVPGVQSVGEGKTGLFVRGGSSDQTLIQLDEAIIFNAFHIGGLFSVFNPDALKGVKLYKGAIPVQYGGRLSSVLDIRMKEGNDIKLTGSGGWGTVSTRLTLEGPLFNSKTSSNAHKGSFIISGRRTYLDLLLKLSGDPEVKDNTLFFYDFNAKMNYSINNKNRIFVSAYQGRDVFKFQDEVSLNWGNLTSTIRWNHVFNSRLFLNTTFLYSKFNNGFTLSDNIQGFTWDSNLKNYAIKSDFYHYLKPSLELNYGYSIIWHKFSPARIGLSLNEIAFEPIRLSQENALEQGLYFSAKNKLSEDLEIGLGLRISAFQNFGPGQYYRYHDGVLKMNETIIDTVNVNSFELMNSEFGFEPRVNVKYKLSENTALKASYNRNKQYLHVLTTNNVGFPSDRYKPSDPNLKPQTSNQFSLGIFNEHKKNYSLSAEFYYKYMKNLAEISNEPNALISPTIEQQVSIGKGWTYGMELSIRKDKGKTTGWVSYTWSRAWSQVPGLNEGEKFHPFYDRTHDFNISASYKASQRVKLSSNWIYSSGQALSLPIGKYVIDDKTIPRFDDANFNGNRGPAYHRLDFSMEIKGKNKKKHNWQGSWNIAFYNVYLRKNPIGFQYRDVINGDPNIEETDKGVVVESREFKRVTNYLFRLVPSITYNFKF